MNLQEKLRKAGIDCFRMAHLYENRISHEEEMYSPWDEDLADYDIVNPYIASQYGLICEYYMKGMLLPTLKLTNPENNPKLQQIIDNLSDEEKYRIIIGDTNIERELSKKYNVSLKDIKKLSGESIKNIGHSLKGLSEKILEKAQNGQFDTEKENETLIKLFENNILQFAFLDQYVSDSFVKGRYGHLDSTIIDTNSLGRVISILRETVSKFTQGIDISLWEDDKVINDRSIIDTKRFFHTNIKKIYIINDNEIQRVYMCDGNVLIPEYGVEQEVDEEISLYGISSSYHEESLTTLLNGGEVNIGKILERVTDENGTREIVIDNPHTILKGLESQNISTGEYNEKGNILVKRGETIFISLENGESCLAETCFGKIAIAPDHGEGIYSKKVEEYENLVSQKNTRGDKKPIKYHVGINTTKKLINPNTSLSKKYAKRVKGKEALEGQLSTMRYGFGRPTASEFRRAYMQYAKGTLSYRLAKGREIFQQIIGEISKGKSKTKVEEIEYGDK